MSKADRYISQNALIKEIAKIHGNLNTGNVGQAIWATPTADVEEVRHGHWIVCGTFDDFLKCSLCESDKYPMTQVINHKYCPDCGAKMDGERKEKNGK